MAPKYRELVSFVKAYLEAHPSPSPRSRDNATQDAIDAFRKTHPAFRTANPKTLRRRYYEALKLPPADEDRWTAILIEWSKATKRHPAFISAEQARELVNHLLVVIPEHRRAEVDRLFSHLSMHRTGREKIKWLRLVIARLEANPNYWPIPISRYGRPDVTAGKILSFVTNAPGQEAYKSDIIAGRDLLPTTAQNTLSALVRAGWLVRKASGKYVLPREGVSNYVPGDQAVLNVLAAGAHTFDELVTATGLPEGAVTAAIHRLKERKVVILKDRGKNATYALAGTAPPHVYAREAMNNALRSGKKTMPELEAITGKKRHELWAAYKREEAKRRVKRIVRRGKPAAFALVGA
jgi:DNA-binding IclR family transcriptional regulator